MFSVFRPTWGGGILMCGRHTSFHTVALRSLSTVPFPVPWFWCASFFNPKPETSGKDTLQGTGAPALSSRTMGRAREHVSLTGGHQPMTAGAGEGGTHSPQGSLGYQVRRPPQGLGQMPSLPSPTGLPSPASQESTSLQITCM